MCTHTHATHTFVYSRESSLSSDERTSPNIRVSGSSGIRVSGSSAIRVSAAVFVPV
jgi:hypothetical protein